MDENVLFVFFPQEPKARLPDRRLPCLFGLRGCRRVEEGVRRVRIGGEGRFHMRVQQR
jgi:hypothetical protein